MTSISLTSSAGTPGPRGPTSPPSVTAARQRTNSFVPEVSNPVLAMLSRCATARLVNVAQDESRAAAPQATNQLPDSPDV